MKGNREVIDFLNFALSTELAAYHQYLAAKEYAANYGYTKLVAMIDERLGDEREHARLLTERIIFLEEKPDMVKTSKVNVSITIGGQITFDHVSETDAIKNYNKGIEIARKADDEGTRALLERILKDEEDHVNDLEAQKSQIAQMGIELFLLSLLS